MKKTETEVREWCFTMNNPTEDRDIYGKKMFDSYAKTIYLVIGNEIAPTTGTPHFQGFVIWGSAKTESQLKRKFPGVHWSMKYKKSSIEQAAVYCTEDGDFNEWGKRPVGQGCRSDLEVVRESVSAGEGMRTIVERVSGPQAIRMAEIMLKYKEKKRDFKPEVYWLWGPTGCGKTKLAMEMLDDPWISGKNLKWWEGYDAHEDVLIDDFRGDFCTFHELLRILDRYPYSVECKGGSRQLLAKRMVITSCYRPEEVYRTREDIGQLIRRIDHIESMGTSYDNPPTGGGGLSPWSSPSRASDQETGGAVERCKPINLAVGSPPHDAL